MRTHQHHQTSLLAGLALALALFVSGCIAGEVAAEDEAEPPRASAQADEPGQPAVEEQVSVAEPVTVGATPGAAAVEDEEAATDLGEADHPAVAPRVPQRHEDRKETGQVRCPSAHAREEPPPNPWMGL